MFGVVVTPHTHRKRAKALNDAKTTEEARRICEGVKADTFELSGESFMAAGTRRQRERLSAEVADVYAGGCLAKTGKLPDARDFLECIAFEMCDDGSVRRRFRFKSYF